jgi:hypothetical protein
MIAAVLFALLAAPTPVANAGGAPLRSLEQRVSLLEAHQMLDGQALWGLQAKLSPDALRAVADIELHLAQDRERDEALRLLLERTAVLEKRLLALETVLGDRAVVEGMLRLELPSAQAARAEPQLRVKPAAARPRWMAGGKQTQPPRPAASSSAAH